MWTDYLLDCELDQYYSDLTQDEMEGIQPIFNFSQPQEETTIYESCCL